jgi:hypothetical protein
MKVVVRETVAELGMPLRYHAARRVRLELARFACQIRKVTVLITEAKNSDGSSRTRCFIAAEMGPSGVVFVDHSGLQAYLTVTQAIQRLAGAITQREREERHSEAVRAAKESEALSVIVK